MKKRKLFFVLTAYCMLTTACYPGDVKKTPTGSTDGSSISENLLQTDNEKLHIKVTEDEVITANQTTALTGVIATVRPWNEEVLMELFGDEIESEREIEVEPVDVKNYRAYELYDGGSLWCYDGYLHYRKSERAGSLYSSYFSDLYARLTPSLQDNRFPNDELDDFPLEDAMATAQSYIDKLEISVYGEPNIWAMDLESVVKIREEQISTYGEDESFYPEWTKEDEAYLFFYQLAADSMPLTYYDFAPGEDMGYYLSAMLLIVVSKSGVMTMECQNVMEIDTSAAVEIPVYSAEDCFQAVKENQEHMVLMSDTTLENLYFGYGLKYMDDFTSELVPMYYVGSYSMETLTVEEGSIIDPVPEPHFVSAETGKELT